MIEHSYSFRVMYPDTDQMGTVHHSNYVRYCETARWELFRSIGLSYNSLEKAGYLLPVINMRFRFLKTVHYDDLLTMKTNLKSVKGAKILFTYRLYNLDNEIVSEAETELAFVNSKDWKPCIAPEFVVQKIKEIRDIAVVKTT